MVWLSKAPTRRFASVNIPFQDNDTSLLMTMAQPFLLTSIDQRIWDPGIQLSIQRRDASEVQSSRTSVLPTALCAVRWTQSMSLLCCCRMHLSRPTVPNLLWGPGIEATRRCPAAVVLPSFFPLLQHIDNSSTAFHPSTGPYYDLSWKSHHDASRLLFHYSHPVLSRPAVPNIR